MVGQCPPIGVATNFGVDNGQPWPAMAIMPKEKNCRPLLLLGSILKSYPNSNIRGFSP